MPPISSFDADPDLSSLPALTARGTAISLLSQVVRFVIVTGTTAVVARILTPGDYGLIGMVAVIIGLAELFKEMGLSMSTIQSEVITQHQVSNLFWLNLSLGVILCAVVACLAPAVAWLYGDERLRLITLVLSSSFLISGLGVQHSALLKRKMRFGAVATAEIIGLLAGCSVAIFVAIKTHSYWALVAQQLVITLGMVLSFWVLNRWRPSLPRLRSGTRPLLRFGGYLTGSNFIVYLCRNLDNLLIGVVWGAQSLGLYSKSYQLLLMPVHQINGPLTSVFLPALSRVQHDAELFRSWYRKGLGMLAMVSTPFCFFLFFFAEEIILLVLGDQWVGAIPIFRALAPAAFVAATNIAGGWVIISLGQTDRLFRMSLITGSITVIAFFIGLPWGPIGVAIAVSVVGVLLRVPVLKYSYKYSPLTLRDYFGPIGRPSVYGLISGLGAFTAMYFLQPYVTFLLLELLLGAAIFGVLYAAGYAATPGSRKDALQFWNALQLLKKKA